MKKVDNSAFYPRKLLILEILRNGKNEIHEIISNLESPLKLALILIDAIFTENGKHLKDWAETLDETKKVAFGLGSAERLFIEFSDKLAMYSFYQFAFQQFVQSSFRARQGKALEEILKKILTIEDVGISPEIPSSKNEKIELFEELIGSKDKAKDIINKHDIDLLAKINNKIIILQMRSRDDTGGATAKPSLAELLRKLKDENLSKEIFYIIYIWVKPDTEPQQKITLINKLLSMINLEGRADVKKILKQGKVAQINKNLKICVVYGAEELIRTLWNELGIEIDGEKYEKIFDKYKRYLDLLSTWDDLWLSYAVATLELENLVKHRRTNVSIISEKLSSMNLRVSECLENYEECSAKISKEIAPLIKDNEDLIPFNSIGDKINYIRDILLLKIIYEHIEDAVDKIGIDSETRKRIKKLQIQKDRFQTDITKFFN